MEAIRIGLPRGLLFYRYEALFRGYFKALGVQLVVSEPTTQAIAETGASVTIDESCLSAKIFMGHVHALLGQCDYILIPRISGFGRGREMCPRFEALYDMTANIYRDSGQEFLPFNVDFRTHRTEQDAFLSLGEQLGFPVKTVKNAYAAAKKAEQKQWKQALQQQEALFARDGLKILIAAHSYVTEDAYIGKPVVDFLRRNGAVPIRGDVVDRDDALKRSRELSPTCKWELNREIVGCVAQNKNKVDGIILLSTFPCGTDAMTNDILLRRVTGVPMLNLVLDGQNGTAGVETRLESFLDIIRLRKGLL